MPMKEFLKELINAKSTSDVGELECARKIQKRFCDMGIDAEVDIWNGNRANIFARIKSSGEKPALVVGPHIDVVPPGNAKWFCDPFKAEESEGKIYGRGAADMKGGIVAFMEAIRRIIESGENLKGDIIFAGVAGEETNSCGAKRFVEKFKNSGEKIAGVLIPEPTNFQIVNEHRGLLWLKVITEGKIAHGSTPELGVNAIKNMRKVMDRIDDIELPKSCTLSMNMVSGGKAFNVIPDECSLSVDIRTVPGVTHYDITDIFVNLLDDLSDKDEDFNAQLGTDRDVEAMRTDPDCKFAEMLKEAAGVKETVSVGYCTDAPFFKDLGTDVLIFGPGDTVVCHKPDECIEISDLEKGADIFVKIIRKFCC